MYPLVVNGVVLNNSSIGEEALALHSGRICTCDKVLFKNSGNTAVAISGAKEKPQSGGTANPTTWQ
jgi:hypothetical protein